MFGGSSNSNTSPGGLQLIVAMSFLVVTVASFAGLMFFLPSLSLAIVASISMLTGFVVSGLLGRIAIKHEQKQINQSAADIRNDREMEKQKQIDEMLRDNSNIPNVKRD